MYRNSHEEWAKEEYGVQQHSHDLKGINHASANICGGQAPTQVETEDSHAVQSKKREDCLSIY